MVIMTQAAADGPVPGTGWQRIAWRLREVWDPVEAVAHIAIYAMTRTGKTHLITHVILPLCAAARVVIIDAKGHDRAWRDVGREVPELPADLSRGGGGPAGMWWRLVVNTTQDPDGAERTMRAALRRIALEGHTVVIIDEGLDLEGVRKEVGRLLTQGGSHGVSVVISATSTEFAPPQMHRQWGVMLAGQMPDGRSHERIAEIAAMPNPAVMKRVIGGIPRRTFLYVDRAGEIPPLPGEDPGPPVPVPAMAFFTAPD